MLIGDEELSRPRFIKTLLELAGDLRVSAEFLADRVFEGLYDGVAPSELLSLTAETAASLATQHPDYSILAARVALKNLYKTTKESFVDTIEDLRNYKEDRRSVALIDEDTYKIALANRELLDGALEHSRDRSFTYFGLQTLTRSYLLRTKGKISERPQHLFMRTALGIHGDNIEKVIETYNLLSNRYISHATPTLYNAATLRPQLSSCFLVAMKDDSIEGIFQTLKDCAQISKYAGGIGLHVSNIRATNSYIAGTNGSAAGLVPMLRVFNNMARYVDQGGNRRPGAISITLEPWHADIFEFLDMRKNHGKEEYRARDLFYALWVPDLFMRKVEENQPWYLFSPDTAPGLADVHGKEFEKLYEEYVEQGRFVSTVPAQKLWSSILTAQIETGNPSILYKDACNAKSNQQNLGTIKSSNLCTEIIQYSDPENIAVCNLASIALPQFVSPAGEFDHDELHRVVKVVTRNLDKIIDINYYHLEETKRSNLNHRPIGVGVQGLADTFFKLRIAFDSPEARALNKAIFETIYHGAVETSIELAKDFGPYTSYEGSPASEGKLQYDMWGVDPSNRWNWNQLKADLRQYGMRNSLLTAVMPTASTSQIMGFTECIEPVTSNIYARRVLSGEFQVVNRYLVEHLEELGLWNQDMRSQIMADNGSVQLIDEIPEDVKRIYKTVWEISQRVIIDMSADRGAFIDHSQSMNVFLRSPGRRQLTSMHFYGWKNGLKTGMYYLRTLGAAAPIQVTIDHDIVEKARVSRTPMTDAAQPGSKRAKLQSSNLTPPSSCDMCAG